MATGDKYVMDGSWLTCDKGVTPTRFMVTPKPVVLYDAQIANEADRIPLVNILPFGVCSVTRTPCVPAPVMWDRVADTGVTALGARPLLDTSKCQCGVGGQIAIHFTRADASAAVALDQQLDQVDAAADAVEEASGWAFWGGLAMGIGGAILVATGVGAPLGAAMITGAGYLMTASTIASTAAAVTKGVTKFARDPSKEVGLAIVGEVAFEAAKNYVMQKLGGKLIQRIARSSLGKRVLNSPFVKKIEDRFERACVGNRASQAQCTRVGEPVDVATGKVINEGTDFGLGGPLPLTWERVWYSTSAHDGALGRGWHHSYDEELYADEELVILRLPDGRYTGAEALAPGESVYLREQKITLTRDPAGSYSYLDGQHLVHSFAYCAATDSHKLVRLADEAIEAAILFTYTHQGFLAGITDSSGRQLTVDSDAAGRLLAIRAPHPTEPRGEVAVVRYVYDEESRLVSATDALDQSWQFRYAGPLLVQATYKNGLSFYYEYDGAEIGARCLRTWGDEGIYACQLSYDLENHRTLVVDSVGAQRIYEYDPELGVVTRLFDARGGITTLVYNEYLEKESEIDPLGRETRYAYDARGNCICTERPDGSALLRQYDAQDRLVQFIDAIGGQWQWQYNDAGQLLQQADPVGRALRYTYTAGQLTAITDPAAGRTTTLSYDQQRNLLAVRTADGQQSRRLYDNWSRPFKLVDARGNVQWREYDLLNRVITAHEPDGNVHRFSYDALDNVTRTKDRNHDVRFAYRGLGRLVRRVEAGAAVEFLHDTEERLRAVVNEHGLLYRFELDAEGAVVTETGFDGLTRRYLRDTAGRVAELTLPGGQRTRYTYDLAGNVTEVLYADGSSQTYRYRADGALLLAANDSTTVTFERDPLGNVLREEQGSHVVSSEYGAAGRRVGLRSSLGAEVRFGRDDAGRIDHIRAGSWQARFRRDAQGLELQRSLSGGVRAHWRRDALGRPVEQHIHAGFGKPEHTRRYGWQSGAQLGDILDSEFGLTRFEHDAWGNLAATSFGDGIRELRHPDATGNLFRTEQRQDRQYGPAGQLLRAGDTRYTYDEQGNLSSKTLATGQEWRYQWNAAGHLAEVLLSDGSVVRFAYDALGRRVRKSHCGQLTHWVWDGNKPLHEWVEPEQDPAVDQADSLVTWLFEEDSYAPAAKLTEQGSYSIVCDHLGTPLALYDAHGHQTWQARLDSYGAVRQPSKRPQDCPFRYQGQYEDAETGLYYNRFRYYDPEAGQYISQDPIRLHGGNALYAYVHTPLTWVDVLGLAGCPKKAANTTMADAQAGKVRRTGDYHGRLGSDKEMEILANPDAVYHSTGKNGRLTFRKGDDVVITEGPGSKRGQVLTSYGPSGPRGSSGAAIFGGQASDPGLPVTHAQIVNGQIPVPSGGFLAPATQIFP